MEDLSLEIIKIKSRKPRIWFKYEVRLNGQVVAELETQLDRFRDEKVYCIYKLYVHPKFRRKRIGSKIIDFCIGLAKRRGLKKLVCWIRPLDRDFTEDMQIRFYEANGFIVKTEKPDNLYAVIRV